MGAAASIGGYDQLSADEQAAFKAKFDALVAAGKSEEEAVVELTKSHEQQQQQGGKGHVNAAEGETPPAVDADGATADGATAASTGTGEGGVAAAACGDEAGKNAAPAAADGPATETADGDAAVPTAAPAPAAEAEATAPTVNEAAMQEKNGLTAEEFARLKATFSKFDKNRDGSMSTAEVAGLLAHFGMEDTESHRKTLLATMDPDNTGTIDFAEFVQASADAIKAVRASTTSDATLLAAFKDFDKDGSGFVNEDELRQALTDGAAHIPEDVISQLFQSSDKDKDGRINYKEFVGLMTGS